MKAKGKMRRKLQTKIHKFQMKKTEGMMILKQNPSDF